jgi:hypothetical protein
MPPTCATCSKSQVSAASALLLVDFFPSAAREDNTHDGSDYCTGASQGTPNQAGADDAELSTAARRQADAKSSSCSDSGSDQRIPYSMTVFSLGYPDDLLAGKRLLAFRGGQHDRIVCYAVKPPMCRALA